MARRFLFRFAATLTLVLAALTPAARAQQAPPTPGNVTGRSLEVRGAVRYADTEKPAELIRVDLLSQTLQTVATAYTHGHGNFEFYGIAPGAYFLSVKVHGYQEVREPLEIVASSRVGIQLYLLPEVSIRTESNEASVNVRQLSLPKDARAAFLRGVERLYRRGDAKGSIGQFERAVEEYPDYYEAYHTLGVAHLELGQREAAEKAFRKSIQVSEQTYAPAFVSLAGMRNSEKRYEEALVLARRAMELDATGFECHFEISRALLNLGRIPEAEVSMRETQQRKPDFPDIYLLYANLSMRKRDLSGLIASLEEYLKLEPKGPSAENARRMLEQARAEERKAKEAGKPQG